MREALEWVALAVVAVYAVWMYRCDVRAGREIARAMREEQERAARAERAE